MSHALTSELQRWINEQSAAGFTPQALHQAMLEAGWDPGLAQDLLTEGLRQWHEAQVTHEADVLAATVADAQLESGRVGGHTPHHGPQPHINLHGAPRQLDLGDRVVDVLLTLQSPKLVVLGGFLSDEECDALVQAAQPRMKRSLTVQTHTGGEELNADRTSNGMFFRRGESPLVARVEARIAQLLHWPVENGEGLQVLHYQPGAQYRPHYDYFDPHQRGTAQILQRGGQRVGTVLMYLNNPVRGGSTVFPDVGLDVVPQRGHAVFFGYHRPHPSTQTLHGGAPVLEGEKWVATKWLREREFV